MTKMLVTVLVLVSWFGPQSPPASKFQVVLTGGPFKGSYDVTGEPCMAGLQKKGSWHATWETDKEQKGKLSVGRTRRVRSDADLRQWADRERALRTA
jgi:hypothetical protein